MLNSDSPAGLQRSSHKLLHVLGKQLRNLAGANESQGGQRYQHQRNNQLAETLWGRSRCCILAAPVAGVLAWGRSCLILICTNCPSEPSQEQQLTQSLQQRFGGFHVIHSKLIILGIQAGLFSKGITQELVLSQVMGPLYWFL